MEQEEITRTRLRTTLSDYGPTVLGIVIVILIIVVGWSFFQSKSKKTVPMPSSIAEVSPSPITIENNQPTAKLNLGGVEPLPAQAGATPAPSPSTKGGVSKLPETGFPLLPMAIASLGMLGTGFYLRKKTS